MQPQRQKVKNASSRSRQAGWNPDWSNQLFRSVNSMQGLKIYSNIQIHSNLKSNIKSTDTGANWSPINCPAHPIQCKTCQHLALQVALQDADSLQPNIWCSSQFEPTGVLALLNLASLPSENLISWPPLTSLQKIYNWVLLCLNPAKSTFVFRSGANISMVHLCTGEDTNFSYLNWY